MNQLIPADRQVKIVGNSLGMDWDITLKVQWNSLAENTRSAYKSALNRFGDWVEQKVITDLLIAQYITELDREGKASSTISTAVAAIKWVDKKRGLGVADGVFVALTDFGLTDAKLHSIRRDSQNRGRGQAAPLCRKEVKAMCKVALADALRVRGHRDNAIFRVMRDGLLRISEIVNIDVDHLQDTTLWIPKSKTDQAGVGVHLHLTRATRQAVAGYKILAGIEEGALFRKILKRSERVMGRLKVDDVRAIIKKRAVSAKITGKVNGHSFRIGSAIDLAKKHTLAELQTAGRWKDSRMPAHYAGAVEAGKGAVATTFEEDNF